MSNNDINDKLVKNTVTKLMNAAKEEINDERTKEFTAQIKLKLRALGQAEDLVKNIKREITDMQIGIAEKLS